ncbi:MAG: hypothetical protein EPO23_03215 [Xanthobacteraceae bacterium]|nr:MAG: hypothetical protein EPO23_03215 [Xanthobacteraceae bacterium]
MAEHPIDGVLVDDVDVSKSAFRAYEKTYLRQRFGTVSDVRNTQLAGQFGGAYVESLKTDFYLDTADTTSADNGTTCLISLDGYRFKAISRAEMLLAQRIVTAAGAVAINDVDDIVVISKTVGAATTVNLPASAARPRPIRIVDGKYDAATHAITIVPNGAETIMGGASFVVDSNGASIILTPLADGSGWI